MKITRHIISLFLILTVLFSGLHVFQPEDINRSGRVGLEDAILSVKAFLGLGDAPEEFASKIKNTISTFQISAGLKTVIKKADNKDVQNINPVYLVSVNDFFNPVFTFSYVYDYCETFSTNLFPPRTPPPKFLTFLVC
ncbi:Uncharacterized protein dnl_07780 [Desulfonema limicola]|uniref:Uncharacterized protein n=1 Tax=Desulfonema limicola TaxID=45656 RepID=A0A975GEW5_9BACT|nr:hypothetical protein [Desulfonema limicola]QTA78554.1 Uncharacterized protein dnl_07780 [Desulfonema limicola]